MQQTLVWKPRHTPGVETLRLNQDAHGIHATSHLMQVIRGNSIAANYLIDCDARWRFRRLWLKVDNHGQRKLSLERDLRGNWLLNGEPRPELQQCQHIMLSASPFTPPLCCSAARWKPGKATRSRSPISTCSVSRWSRVSSAISACAAAPGKASTAARSKAMPRKS